MMVEKDLISVIIPVYNGEKYLRCAMDSIVNQSYQNLEILLVNDGSKDGTAAICDQYATDPRVRVFHRPNSGLAATRQFGIDNCKGAYFVTIDHDDYVAADYVEKLYVAITKNDADIAVCGVSCFSDGTDRISEVYMPHGKEEKIVLTNKLLTADFYQLTSDFIMTDSWNKMHRTQFVKESHVGYEILADHVGADMLFEHKLALHSPVYGVCRESLLFHRLHEGGIMRTGKDARWQETFEQMIDSLIEECQVVGISLRRQLSGVYYGMLGILVSHTFYYGGSMKEKHARFKTLVQRNKHFLSTHRNQLDKLSGLQTYHLMNVGHTLPAFTLSNALWLDAVVLCMRMLYRMKRL